MKTITYRLVYCFDQCKIISDLNASKSGHPKDLPIRLIKEFAFEIAIPLTSIFNACLQEGVFPSVWKTAAIIPVPKISNPQTPNELRPIALTPILGRVFESLLAKWLREDFEPQLDPQQYGNVKGISTAHYLVDMLHDTLSDLESPGTFTTLCAIDFTKAFDRINHTVAIRKIIESDVRPSIILTISSFLSDRNQCVKLQDHLSDPRTITCSVPQGTKFSPLL